MDSVPRSLSTASTLLLRPTESWCISTVAYRVGTAARGSCRFGEYILLHKHFNSWHVTELYRLWKLKSTLTPVYNMPEGQLSKRIRDR